MKVLHIETLKENIFFLLLSFIVLNKISSPLAAVNSIVWALRHLTDDLCVTNRNT